MKQIADLMVLVFVVSSVTSVGLNLTVSQIVAPLRQTMPTLAPCGDHRIR